MNFYTRYQSDFKKNFILYIPLSIIFQSCIGSIAAMYILMNSSSSSLLFEISLCVIVSMTYNAAIMAQLKTNWVFNLLILSIVVNVLLIVLNLIALNYP